MAQPLRLPGQWYDEESGLHYNRHRYYDPQQGRYITQDPIGLAGGWNLYQYPLDPVSDIDPLGLSGWDGLGKWLSLPGVKEASSHAAAQAEDSIAKPVSEWKFSGWEVTQGSRFGNHYTNVDAMCKDQFGNIKSVSGRSFQSGWFTINEVEPGMGLPDPNGQASNISSNTNSIIDSVSGLTEAHSRALTCSSKSNAQCFIDNEANPALGKKLCAQR